MYRYYQLVWILGVAFLLTGMTCAAQESMKPKREPLANRLKPLLTGQTVSKEGVVDIVNDMYLICLEDDWFPVR